MKIWIHQQLYGTMDEVDIEAEVEKSLAPTNLRIEIRKQGKWEEE